MATADGAFVPDLDTLVRIFRARHLHVTVAFSTFHEGFSCERSESKIPHHVVVGKVKYTIYSGFHDFLRMLRSLIAVISCA